MRFGSVLRTAAPWLRSVAALSKPVPESSTSLLQATSFSSQLEDGAPSILPGEIEKFRRTARTWWDPKGPFKPLHALNPTRCKFMRDFACLHFNKDTAKPDALSGLTVLDVGCGGGILSEAMARMGATVLGIDAVEESIAVAEEHASLDPCLASRLRFEATSAESLAQGGHKFDMVVASEVIEHVNDPLSFITVLKSLTKPEGCVIVSTINRTPQAYVGAIFVAETVMGLVPRGTHEWRKFISPDELVMAAMEAKLRVQHIAGMLYNPILNSWSLTKDVSINYIAAFEEQG